MGVYLLPELWAKAEMGGLTMTVKELYEWASRENVLDAEIEIQYRDGGGVYPGRDDCDPYLEKVNIDGNIKTVVVL